MAIGLIAVGDYLQERRKAAGLTQDEVARQLGVAGRTVSDWEAGRYSPSFVLMARLVRLIQGRIEDAAQLLLEDGSGDRRAEFEALAQELTDEELQRALEAVRSLRANVGGVGGTPTPAPTQRRQGSRKKPRG